MDERWIDDQLRLLFKRSEPKVSEQLASDEALSAITADQLAHRKVPRKRPRGQYRKPLIAALVLLLVCGVGAAALLILERLPTREVLVLGDETTSTDDVVSTSLSEGQLAQSWYESGAFHGLWAGNVETIPSSSRHLPDFFYAGATPVGPLGSALKDPSMIKKPLWVFGDEISVDTVAGQIRHAMEEGRPVLFYATSMNAAVVALGLEQQSTPMSPLDHLIIKWPSSTAGDLSVDVFGWSVPEEPTPTSIFMNLVLATLS